MFVDMNGNIFHSRIFELFTKTSKAVKLSWQPRSNKQRQKYVSKVASVYEI